MENIIPFQNVKFDYLSNHNKFKQFNNTENEFDHRHPQFFSQKQNNVYPEYDDEFSYQSKQSQNYFEQTKQMEFDRNFALQLHEQELRQNSTLEEGSLEEARIAITEISNSGTIFCYFHTKKHCFPKQLFCLSFSAIFQAKWVVLLQFVWFVGNLNLAYWWLYHFHDVQSNKNSIMWVIPYYYILIGSCNFALMLQAVNAIYAISGAGFFRFCAQCNFLLQNVFFITLLLNINPEQSSTCIKIIIYESIQIVSTIACLLFMHCFSQEEIAKLVDLASTPEVDHRKLYQLMCDSNQLELIQQQKTKIRNYCLLPVMKTPFCCFHCHFCQNLVKRVQIQSNPPQILQINGDSDTNLNTSNNEVQKRFHHKLTSNQIYSKCGLQRFMRYLPVAEVIFGLVPACLMVILAFISTINVMMIARLVICFLFILSGLLGYGATARIDNLTYYHSMLRFTTRTILLVFVHQFFAEFVYKNNNGPPLKKEQNATVFLEHFQEWPGTLLLLILNVYCEHLCFSFAHQIYPKGLYAELCWRMQVANDFNLPSVDIEDQFKDIKSYFESGSSLEEEKEYDQDIELQYAFQQKNSSTKSSAYFQDSQSQN